MDFLLELEEVGDKKAADLDSFVFVELLFPSMAIAATRTDWVRRVTGRSANEVVGDLLACGVVQPICAMPRALNAGRPAKCALFVVCPDAAANDPLGEMCRFAIPVDLMHHYPNDGWANA